MVSRKFLSFCAGICVFLFVAVAYAQVPQVTSGVTYLASSQSVDGTWGNGSIVDGTAATVTALDTLKLLNESAGMPYSTGISWLQGQSPQSVAYTAERIRALVLGADSLDSLLSALDQLKGAWGGGEGYETDILDTAIVLKALKSADYADATITSKALAYLTANQNSDGGWGFCQGDESNVFLTAQMLSTLSLFRSYYIMDRELANAAAFLISKQNPDGGFGSEGSTTYETALAFIALVESGHGSTQALQNAIAYLTSTQSSNGSWNDDAYSTALALHALALVKPDLSIAASDIVASPISPTVGDIVTITATVRNAGLENSREFDVRLLDNGVIVGEQTVAAIAPGGFVAAPFTVSVSPYGDHSFSVVLDPANAVAESSETNNSATLRVWAKTPADLVVMPEYISISPAYPRPGDTITLTARVANMGENSAGAFSADVYDGDPSSGSAKLLGTFFIPGILPGQTGAGTISFTLADIGVHNLHVVIDPSNSVSESSEENNRAAKEITVSSSSATGYIDLVLPPTGLSVAPQRPTAGETVTVSLLAGNFGTDAAAAEVEIFDGDPANGGVLLHKSTVNLNGAETKTVTASWQVPAGIHTLSAYIDRTNVVAERDETNNSNVLTVMADMVDLEVSASDIVIEPEHPMDGDTATVKVTVQNRGIKATGPFHVSLYNGDPANGGVLLQSFPVADLAGDAAQTITYPMTAARGTYRFYVVCDQEKVVTEFSEDNNLAIRSLLVKTSAEAKGPDLVPIEFDVTDTSTDPQSLHINGSAKVKFQNKGDDKVATPFRITIFEDKDNDGIFTDGTDTAFGFWDYTGALNPSMVATVNIQLSGHLSFRDAPIFAEIDSEGDVYEQDEDNNSIRRGSACESRPVNPIDPVLKWEWRSGKTPNMYLAVSPPVVIGLTDDNADGKIDDKDTPSVLFITKDNINGNGMLKVLNGKTGQQRFSVSNPARPINLGGYVVAGDTDNDGKPEIILPTTGMGLLSYRNDGRLMWDNTDSAYQYYLSHNQSLDFGSNRVAKIADLNGSGHPVIVSGTTVVNPDGSIRSSSSGHGPGWGYGNANGMGASAVADLDMDGVQEIVVANAAYNADGTVKWYNPAVSDGVAVVANFDEDPYPEIVSVSYVDGFKLYLLEPNGTIKWGPVNLASLEGAYSYNYGSVPTVADFDGDGDLEIGIKGINNYFIIDKAGHIKRILTIPRQDTSLWYLAATVFDLNGDGRPEIILYSDQYLRIFDGKTGAVLYEERAGSITNNYYVDWAGMYQGVIVADVDGDGHAELVAVGQNWTSGKYEAEHWVRVYGAADNTWQSTSRVWNQPGYHVTNVNNDGTIPRYEAPSWLTNNSYHCNIATDPLQNPYLAADLSASFLRVDLTGYPSSASVTARIGNGGAKTIAAGVRASLYGGDPDNGGALIGTALTSRTLDAGEFEDVVVNWSAPAEGNHVLTFKVDPDGLVPECDKANNTITLQTAVAAGRPDPAVTAEDIAVASLIPEGKLAEVAITVKNLGIVRTDNVPVRLYTGNPAAGGKQIGTDKVIPTLAAGGSSTVTVTWDTLGAQGATYLYAIVDPNAVSADDNRGNNTAFKQVTVSAAVKPDLQITVADVTTTPVVAGEGEIVTVAIDIHNRGIATGNFHVALYNGDPATGGRLVQNATVSQLTPFGGTTRAILTLDTLGMSGTVTWFVKVDPENTVDESDEANNQASGTVTIDSSGLTLGATTDKTSYSANEAAVLNISASELKAVARTLTLDVQVQDEKGVVAAVVTAGTPVDIAAGAKVTLPVNWNTGTTYSGSYTILAMVQENGRVIARATTPLAILPVKTAAAAIAVDKVAYGANEDVIVTTTVSGTSPNYFFTDLIATVTVADPASTVLFSTNRSITTLANGQRVESKSYWNTGTLSPGSYPVMVEIKDAAGSVITTAASVITVSSSARPSTMLQGSVTVDKQSLLAGEPVNVSYTLKNVGNADLANVAVSVIAVHVGNGTVSDTLAYGASLAMGATTAASGAIDTTDYSAKDYLVILRGGIDGVEESIASTYFRVEGAPSAPALVSPVLGGDVEALPAKLVVGNAADPNDDKLNYEFELYADQVLSSPVVSGTVPETAGNTAWTVPASLMENQSYFWRTRAFDGRLYGPWMPPAYFRVNTVDDAPSAPTVSSPMTGSEVAQLAPALTVGNATDPDSANLTYNFQVALDLEFAQVVAAVTGVAGGDTSTSWQIPVSLEENRTYYWRAQADDWLIEGPWSAPAHFFVNTANDAPATPVILAPADKSTATALAADIVAGNSADPDSPAVSYIFEADTSPSFDSPGIIRSGMVPEGEGGTTTWHLDGLQDNTPYYVRVKASDGAAESPWAGAEFFTNTANDAPSIPALANPSEGAGVTVFAPVLSVHAAADIDRDALSYQFELYVDAAMTSLVVQSGAIAEAGNSIAWQVPQSLTENQTYYWRARAFDGSLYGEWMPKASFTVNTANDSPSAPSVLLPVDGSSVTTTTPLLSVANAADPDSSELTYQFEIYADSVLVATAGNVAEDSSGITTWMPAVSLADNTVYQWRGRAFDGDSYGPWTTLARFTVHLPKTSITATVDFDPDTLNGKSNGTWVVVYVELPAGYHPNDVDISSIRLEGSVPAEARPYSIGDHDKDGNLDLMVKFRRSDVINLLGAGEKITVHLTGKVGEVQFEGVDIIRVIK